MSRAEVRLTLGGIRILGSLSRHTRHESIRPLHNKAFTIMNRGGVSLLEVRTVLYPAGEAECEQSNGRDGNLA